MSAASIPTQKLTGLDYRVWLVMLFTWLVCLGLFGYRKVQAVSASGKPCGGAELFVNGKNEAVAIAEGGRIATFRLQANGGDRVEWSFDDGSGKAYGAVVSHKFEKEGNYRVVARVNGTCTYEKEVLVKTQLALDPVVRVLKIFSDSDKTLVGSSMRFSGVSNLPVTEYEWTLLETGDVQRGEVVHFTFPGEGTYSVQLVANRDYLGKVIRSVKVEGIALPNSLPVTPEAGGFGELGPLVPPSAGGGSAEPPRPTGTGTAAGVPAQTAPAEQGGAAPAQPLATNVNPETFKALLQGVLNGDKEIDELYPYLPYGASTQVLVNGRGALEPLKVFCRENRRKRIESLELKYNEQKSIQTIHVRMRRRWPFG